MSQLAPGYAEEVVEKGYNQMSYHVTWPNSADPYGDPMALQAACVAAAKAFFLDRAGRRFATVEA